MEDAAVGIVAESKEGSKLVTQNILHLSGAIGSSGDEKDMLSPFPLELFDDPLRMIEPLSQNLLENTVLHPSNEERKKEIPVGWERFKSKSLPLITLTNYLARIVKYTTTEPVVLLALLIYRRRLEAHAPSSNGMVDPYVNPMTVHRFVIAATVAASKALCDHYYTNAFYARVGGISVRELKRLELEFCKIMDWRLQCSPEELATAWDWIDATMQIIDGARSTDKELEESG